METATTEQPRKRHAPQDWEINQIWAEPLIHCHVRLPNLKVCSLEVGVWFVPRRTDADPLEWGWQVCEETGLVRWNCPDFRNKDHFPTWEAALADAFRALLRLGDDAAAARLAAFEAGPADGGAPAAGWAELDREGMAAFAARYPTAAAEPDDDARDDEPAGGEVREFVIAEAWTDAAPSFEIVEVPPTDDARDPETEHLERVQRNFPLVTDVRDGAPVVVCRACGVPAIDHDPEVCRGGTPETRRRAREKSPKNRSGATATESEGLGVSGETPATGHHSPSPGILVLGTNGGHDRADAAGILLDPDKVTATLTEAGWSIAFLADERGGGVYVNYALGDEYETGEVEAAYRAALSGRGAA